MPIYVYRCQECGQEIEILSKVNDDKIIRERCAECDKETPWTRVPTAGGFQIR